MLTIPSPDTVFEPEMCLLMTAITITTVNRFHLKAVPYKHLR